jgi:hypothetical protein
MYHRKQYVSTAKYDTYGMKYDAKMLESYAKVIEELRCKMQKMQSASNSNAVCQDAKGN